MADTKTAAERARELREQSRTPEPTLQNPRPQEGTVEPDPVDVAVQSEDFDVSGIINRGMNDPRTQERLRTGGGPGFLSPDEGKRFSEAESFGYGMLDMFTGGGAPEFLSVARDSPLKNTPMGPAMGMANSLFDMVVGTPMHAPSPELEAEVDQGISENRGASVAGQLVGAVGPGAVTAKGYALAAKHLPKPLRFLTGTLVGRALSTGLFGAAEGAAYARNKDENVAGGAAAGFVGGAAGSAVLDLVGYGINALFGAASKHSARTQVGKDITHTTKSAANPEGYIPHQEILAEAQGIGPRATLMDVNPGAHMTAETTLQSARRVDESWGIRNLMEERLGRDTVAATGQGAVYDDFTRSMKDMLPQGFDPLSGHVPEARAFDTATRHSREYFQSISDEFGDAIANSSIAQNATSFSQQMNRAARGPRIPRLRGNKQAPANKGITDAWDKVATEIERQTVYDMRPKPGGARGEKMPVARPHTAQQLHNIRLYIDDILDTSMQPNGTALSRNEAAALSRMRTVITDKLDADATIADVNRRYATQASYMRSFELGQMVLSRGRNSMSADEIENWMVSANPGDINGFIEGVSRVLSDKVRAARGEGQMTRLIANDDEIADRLRTIFPNDADRIIQEANAALQLTQTAGDMVRNSRTGYRNMLQERENPGGSILDYAVISGAIYNTLSKGQGVSQAAGLGALRRLLPGLSDPDETFELVRLLTAQGPEGVQNSLIDIEQAMAAGNLNFPRTLSGADKSLAAQAAQPPAHPRMGAQGNLLTDDLGQTLPLAIGAAATGERQNTPTRLRRREQERNRRDFHRNRKR